jgi:hypothetical protein
MIDSKQNWVKSGREYSHVDIANYASLLCENLSLILKPIGPLFRLIETGSTLEQLRDPDHVKSIFLANPGALIGLQTGKESRVTAINAYTTAPGEGMEALEESGEFCCCCDALIRRAAFVDNDLMPWRYHTLLQFTGSNEFPSSYSITHSNVSVIASGETVLIPPGFSTSDYEDWPYTEISFECGRDLLKTGIRPMSKGFFLSLRPLVTTTDATSSSIHCSQRKIGIRQSLFEPIPEGERNSTLTRRLGYLLGVKKLNASEALRVLRKINQECCFPPLERKEVEGIVRSIQKRRSNHGGR